MPAWLAEMRHKVEAARSLFNELPGESGDREAVPHSPAERPSMVESGGPSLQQAQSRELGPSPAGETPLVVPCAASDAQQGQMDVDFPDDDIVAWSQGLRMEDLDGHEDEILQALAQVV